MSSFHPDTRGQRWPLIWAHVFSCVVGREGHCKQTPLVCVGNSCSGWTTLGLPQLKAVCASRVHTAQAPGCCVSHCPTWALCFLHFPGLSRSGSGVPRKGTDLDGLCVPCPSQVQAAQETRCLATGPPEVGNVSYSPAQLLVPGCQGVP